MSLGDLGIGSINGGPIGTKNVIINGNFGINQRGVSGTVTLAAGAYGHDRWKAGASGCTYTFATTNNVTTLTISSGSLIQVIEGLNLYSGTYTLSWTGTAQGKIGAGSYAGSGVTGTAVGGTNLNIEFNTGTVSLVQFEQGSVATPFERRPFGTELALCQRYAYKNTSGNYSGFVYNGVPMFTVPFPVVMRAIPTATAVTLLAPFSSTGAGQTNYTGATNMGVSNTEELARVNLTGGSWSSSTPNGTGCMGASVLLFNAEL